MPRRPHGHRHLVAEAIGGQRDDLQLPFSLRCVYSRSRSASATAIQSVSAARSFSTSDSVAGLLRMAPVIGGFALEQLLVPASPMNCPFSCRPGIRDNLLRELVVVTRIP